MAIDNLNRVSLLLKDADMRVEDVMRDRRISRDDAMRWVTSEIMAGLADKKFPLAKVRNALFLHDRDLEN